MQSCGRSGRSLPINYTPMTVKPENCSTAEAGRMNTWAMSGISSARLWSMAASSWRRTISSGRLLFGRNGLEFGSLCQRGWESGNCAEHAYANQQSRLLRGLRRLFANLVEVPGDIGLEVQRHLIAAQVAAVCSMLSIFLGV